MSYDNLLAAFDLIASHKEHAFFGGPKPVPLIEKAETALGLKFPKTYREFLLQLGNGHIAGEEFYGVIRDDFETPGVPDAIWLTLDERKKGLPHNLVTVCVTGDGMSYALDTSVVDASGENPVVLWGPGFPSAGDKLERVASDFGEFFYTMVKEALARRGI